MKFCPGSQCSVSLKVVHQSKAPLEVCLTPPDTLQVETDTAQLYEVV